MDDITLASGRKVTLRPVTLSERQRAHDTIKRSANLSRPGEIIIEDAFASLLAWARFGLAGIEGVDYQTTKNGELREYPTDEMLNLFSDDEIAEVSVLVRERAELGTQKKKE